MIEHDVIIIGCGAGGFTSAIALAEKGKDVAVISERIPSSALFSGAGYDYEIEKENFIKAIKFFKEVIEAAGFPLTFSGKNLSLITESGGIIESELFFSISAPADLTSILNKKVLFVGVENLDSFIPELIIMRIKKLMEGGTDGWSAKRIKVPVKDRNGGLTTITLAKALDTKENFENFLHSILGVKGIQSFDVILFPPVLGYKNFNENYSILKNNLTCTTGELLSSIPSVHGLRLYNAMVKALDERKIKILNGRCFDFTGKGRVESIRVTMDTGEIMEISGNTFIYAPGRFISGGISCGKDVRESLFGLPLYFQEKPLGSYFHSLFNYNYFTPQPALHARIPVDDNFHALKEDGSVFAENLYVAGSITQRSVFNGIIGAVLSGFLCAEAIV